MCLVGERVVEKDLGTHFGLITLSTYKHILCFPIGKEGAELSCLPDLVSGNRLGL